MTRGLFITGTGTSVGKTVTAAAVLRLLRAAGVDAVPFKPVQTGAVETPAGLVAPDLAFSLAAVGLTPPPDEAAWMAPFLYKPACSPHLAARIEGRWVDIDVVAACADKLLTRHDVVVAEGAGGILVPLSETATMLDLMVRLGWPVVVVAHDGLGTINHTLLSLASLRSAGLETLGMVYNQPEPAGDHDEFIRRDNPQIITWLGGAPMLGHIPHVGDLSGADASDWAVVEAGLTGMDAILQRLGDR